jgi:tRNA(adenine34) deaminase
MTEDEHFLREAIEEAKKGLPAGEVPVGAVLVIGGKIVGRGHNLRESRQDPLAHAELVAIRAAAEALHSWRLSGTLYVTLEPCPMCAGALIQARIERLVFGATDPKAGAVGSVINLLQPGLFNHTVEVASGVLAEGCGALMRDFFEAIRAEG